MHVYIRKISLLDMQLYIHMLLVASSRMEPAALPELINPPLLPQFICM
jgi:hypothetical protein